MFGPSYDDCLSVAMDGDTAVLVRDNMEVQFLSIAKNDESLELVTTMKIDYNVSNIAILGNTTTVMSSFSTKKTGWSLDSNR